jgi:non-heme chloroperoxidase
MPPADHMLPVGDASEHPPDRWRGGGWITTADGARLFYKDWGSGPAVLFSHGWPLNADAWDDQMVHLAQRGFRTIAYDRRGHGRSTQTWDGHDLDTYAADLAGLIETLSLDDVVLVGHAMGGSEIVRYVGRHGTRRVARLALIATPAPLMLRTPANPGGRPIDEFDHLRAALVADRTQFYRQLSLPFFGANRPGSQVSQGTRDAFWAWSMQAGLNAVYEAIKVFSETDLTEDLRRIDKPTLMVHGDDDQIVPVATAMQCVAVVRSATLRVYPGAPHGLFATHKNLVSRDLAAFART